jgi:hypothetical protein
MSSLELAISISREVERIGALAGFASILGLAVLSLLYFAQSREVKRLREWAGRSPERDAELRQNVAEAASARATSGVARTPTPAPARPAAANVPATAAAAQASKPATPGQPATPGTPPATTAQPAAGQTATPGTPPGAPPAAGTPKPATPAATPPATGQQPPAAAAKAPATPPPARPAAGAAPATAAAAGAAAGVGAARPRRTVQVGSTPSSATVPTRADRDDDGGSSSFLNARTALLSALGVVLLVVVLLVSGVLGGGDDGDSGAKQATTTPTTSTTAEEGAIPAPADTAVAVLNGTTVTGLARTAADQLEARDYNVARVTDAADQAQQTSQVAYSDGFQGSARRIARIVGIDRANVVPLDESTRVVAGTDVSVVVTMAADKAQ